MSEKNKNVAARSGETWRIAGLILGGLLLLFIVTSLIFRGVTYYFPDPSPSEQSGDTPASAGQGTTVEQAAPWPAERLINLKAGIKSEVIIFPTTYAPRWRIVGRGKKVTFFFNYETKGVLWEAGKPQKISSEVLSTAELIAEEDTEVLFYFVR